MTEFKKTVEIVPMYCPTEDRTFLMEEIRVEGILIREELVGWHYGEPNDEDTRIYGIENRGKYVAEHMTEEAVRNDLEAGIYNE